MSTWFALTLGGVSIAIGMGFLTFWDARNRKEGKVPALGTAEKLVGFGIMNIGILLWVLQLVK